MPATGSSRQMRRTASSSSREVSPPGSGVPVPGAWPGSQTSMSTERKTASHSSRAISNASSRHAAEPALADLGHLVGPHVLLGHPAEGLRAGPVAAQPHLQEPVAAQGAGLDQPAHRLAVAVERAELDVAGVGVGVEVDHRDPAVPEVTGDAGGVRQRDRVVAAEHQRDGAGRRHGVHGLLQRPERALDLAGRHLDVAGVDDADVLERVDAQGQVRAGAVLRQVVGLPDGHRAEPGARPVGGAAVERRPDDDHVGRGQGVGVVEVHGVHAQEGDVRPELGAVSGHRAVPTSRASRRARFGFRVETCWNATDSLAGLSPRAA